MELDREDQAILRIVGNVCAEIETPWMLVGALARDLLLVRLAGVTAGRATNDVDIAVLVESWQAYSMVKLRLIDTGHFEATGQAQRLVGPRGGDLAGRQLDIVPFGRVATADAVLRWPPDADVVMSVAGFNEAFLSSVEMNVGDGLAVRVVSAAGLALLKVNAWRERRHDTRKDALDFVRLLLSYQHVVGVDRLYDDIDLLERCGFNVERSAAWLLGADMRAVALPSTLELILEAFEGGFYADIENIADTSRDLATLYRDCQDGLRGQTPTAE